MQLCSFLQSCIKGVCIAIHESLNALTHSESMPGWSHRLTANCNKKNLKTLLKQILQLINNLQLRFRMLCTDEQT